MGEFIVAHKLALLLIGAALGSFILLTRNKGAQAANGIPVNPYNANSPANGAGGGGGFDISSLLPSGPAGPALDPNPPASNDTSSPPTAGEAPAAVDNSVAATSEPDFASSTFSFTPPAQGGSFPTYIVPADPSTGTPQEYFTPTNYFQNEEGFGLYTPPPPPDAVDRYLANQASRTPASASGTGTAPAVSLPVQPVDLTPRPTPGHAVAV